MDSNVLKYILEIKQKINDTKIMLYTFLSINSPILLSDWNSFAYDLFRTIRFDQLFVPEFLDYVKICFFLIKNSFLRGYNKDKMEPHFFEYLSGLGIYTDYS